MYWFESFQLKLNLKSTRIVQDVQDVIGWYEITNDKEFWFFKVNITSALKNSFLRVFDIF